MARKKIAGVGIIHHRAAKSVPGHVSVRRMNDDTVRVTLTNTVHFMYNGRLDSYEETHTVVLDTAQTIALKAALQATLEPRKAR